MSFQKTGDVSKIKTIATTDKEFENVRQKIAEDNNLIRCKNCNKLLSKKSSDGKTLDFQHKKLAMTIEEPKSVKMQCPACGQVNQVN